MKAIHISSLLVLQIRNNDPLGTTGAAFCFTKVPLYMCFVFVLSFFFFKGNADFIFFFLNSTGFRQIDGNLDHLNHRNSETLELG